MTLAELQQQRARLATEMRTYHDAQGDIEWGDEQRSKWAAMLEDIKNLDDKIEREQELRDQEQRHVEVNREQDSAAARQQGGEATEDEQRSAGFHAYLRGGFGALSAEQRQLLKQDEQRAQAAGVNDKGGYTVPTTFLARVHEAMKAYGGVASVSQILVTDKGNSIEWPTSDGTSEEGELLGENAQASEGDVTFGMDSLGAHKLSSKIIRVSNELLNDTGIDMDGFLSGRIASRIGRGEARLVIQGTGTGTPLQPKGLAASANVGKATASATAFTWKEINGLIHSIDPAYRSAPQFRLAFNDATLQAIEEMEDGQGRPLWLPGIDAGAPATILKQRYVVDQGIASIAAGAKFMFAGDFSQFVIRRVRYMVLKRLTERYADYDQTGFLAFHRFGCVLQDLSAIKALQGKTA